MNATHRPVAVWDGLVRITHWINAFAVLLLLPLGAVLFGREWLGISKPHVETLINIHASIGFLLAASLTIRIAYLLAGEGVASWRDVVPHTKAQFALGIATIRYYLSGCKGECPLYFAHNPLAGLAYTGFFLFAATQVITGAAMYLLGDGLIPAAHAHAGHHAAANAWPPEWLMDFHALIALLIGMFIVAHLSALALHDLVEKRGLASSMISGNKFFTDTEIEQLQQTGTMADEATAEK
ncbi:MAG TPA: cytochrome b/b6 domain-containing protein [Mariprofundaceae bacterium]|nr:cytochrome b/b6 domain-containing protein [Mariprofundaceae bacterium]